jgi:hypothetical protein
MDEAPNSSQGGLGPARVQPARDWPPTNFPTGQQITDYGTNPIAGQSREPDDGREAPSFVPRKSLLADCVSLPANLLHAEWQSARIQIPERTQLPPLAAQRRTFRNRCRDELISGKRTRSYPSASGARRGRNGCSRLRLRCTAGCAQETCCSKRDGRSHLASAEKREHVKQEEP